MEVPTAMVKAPATNQPKVMVAGPPKLRPVLQSVVIPVSTEMMENEKAKLASTLMTNQIAVVVVVIVIISGRSEGDRKKESKKKEGIRRRRWLGKTYERSRLSSCLYPSSRRRARLLSSPSSMVCTAMAAAFPALPSSSGDLFRVMPRVSTYGRRRLASYLCGCVSAADFEVKRERERERAGASY